MPQVDTGHALDEASNITGWNTQNGRYPVGRPVTTPVSLSGKRFHPFGALHREVCVPVRRGPTAEALSSFWRSCAAGSAGS